MNVKTVEGAGRDCIAQPLQSWADQCGPAVAVIDEAVIRPQAEPILDDTRLQGSELAGDGTAGLLVRRDAFMATRKDGMATSGRGWTRAKEPRPLRAASRRRIGSGAGGWERPVHKLRP